MARKRLTIDVEGLDELDEALRDAASSARVAAEGAVGAEAEAIAQDMRDAAPHDTGALEESIQAEHVGLEGTTAATAAHAEFVEHGTSRMAAQPYAEPAAVAAESRFPDRVGDAIRDAVER
jgi:HK97 gp10 family phage protein